MRRINRVLGRRGKLWQDDYWDRYIRDEAHYRKVVHYIESNPVKAGLVKTPEQWPFSSARYRDEHQSAETTLEAKRGVTGARTAESASFFGEKKVRADKAVRAPFTPPSAARQRWSG